MRRLLFCGDGHGAQAVYFGLLASELKPDVCSNDSVILEDAKKNERKVSPDLDSWIVSSQDIILSAAYKPWIKSSTLNRAIFLNVHYALFPAYRGLHSIVWAMLNGEKEVGLTVHQMDLLLDAGPILYQEKVLVGEKTSWQLMEELDALAKVRVGEVVLKFMEGKITPLPQDHSVATFVGKRNKEDCKVSWKEWDAKYFERVLKALVPPYPRAFFSYKEKNYDLVKAEIVHRYYREIPGHVVYIDETSVWVKLVDGLLRIYTLSLEGKEMPATEILKVTGIRLPYV